MDFIGIFEQGLISSFVVLGVFISFRIIDLADLTPEGSFVLGAAITVSCMNQGLQWYISLFLGILFSGISGIVTAFLYNKFKINTLLASILVMTMIYSVNIRIMDGPNLSVPKNNQIENTIEYNNKTSLDDFFENLDDIDENEKINKKAYSPFLKETENRNFVIIVSIVILTILLLYIFFKTELGMVLRAYGSNKEAINNLGINPNYISTLGLFIGNALAGLSGGLFSLYAGFCDVNMGQGIVVIALASVIIGEILLSKFNLIFNLLCPVLGAIIYQFLMSFAMKYGYKIGFKPSDMKLLTALFIVIVIFIKKIEVKKWLSLKK